MQSSIHQGGYCIRDILLSTGRDGNAYRPQTWIVSTKRTVIKVMCIQTEFSR